MSWLVTDLWLFHRSECKALHRLYFSKSHHSTTFWGLPLLTLFQCKFTDENSNVLVHCHWFYSVPLLITVDLAMKSFGSSSSSFHEQLSCVVELKAKFSPWVTLRKLFLPHVVVTVFLRAECCRELGWSIKVQNSAFKDAAQLRKWVWERFTASWCSDCSCTVWILDSVSYQFIFGK